MHRNQHKRRATALLSVNHLACALPGLLLLWALSQGTLGPTPLIAMQEDSGRSSLVILIASLSVTPLRRIFAFLAKQLHLKHGKRISDWNWLVPLRRPLGLWCFFYASLHLWLYAALDLGYDWQAGWEELCSKPYLAIGFAAWALLVPLALTSTKRMMKRLGRHWGKLHSVVYLIAVLVLLHFWLLTKHGVYKPWPDTIALTGLLLYRLAMKTGVLRHWDGDDGTASKMRQANMGAPINSTRGDSQ